MTSSNENNQLRWRFDVSTFRLIGRDLITDRITAVFELVKNCYDANSQRVDIIFENVTSINENSRIIIKDDGYGMTFKDIQNKWMVIGTSNKRTKPYTPAPFNRRCVGEKGIGRFAVDKLGEKVNILTKKKGEQERLNVEINWNLYDKATKNNPKQETGEIILFTDIDNTFSFEPANIEEQGTTIIISEIRDIWVERDIERLYKELSRIVSPFYPLHPPFDIYISCNDFPSYKGRYVTSDTIKYASHCGKISYGVDYQEILRFNKKTGDIYVEKSKLRKFGGVKMQLYFFNEAAKKSYNYKFKNDDTRIDGIKIYRDGLITTPFAEWESNSDKKRDIIGVDKRLWHDIFNKVGSRELIGIVEITKQDNPLIIDATNRQDFVDNEEYRNLKDFIIEQIDVFSEVKKYERENKKKNAVENLKRAKEDATTFVKAIEQLEKEKPELKQSLHILKNQAKQVSTSVQKGLTEQQKAQKEFLRKENIYLSLMSLQDYAANMSHAVRTSISKIKDKAEFFKSYYPNKDLEKYFILYATDIYNNMATLSKVIDYMLSYAGSNIPFEDLNIKKLIIDLFNDYQLRFDNENIHPTIEIRDNFAISANKQFFADIFQNLIDNSIKALKGISNKSIKCSGFIENNQFQLFFSDNGIGIDNDAKEKVFDLYYTTTAEEGGAGLGLFIVKTRIDALKGKVEVIDNEFQPTGTTFKITFPFKK